MKTPRLFKTVALVWACAALAMTVPAEARPITAHAGTTFTLTPIEFDTGGNPTKFAHTVDGVVRVSLFGNCTVHFDVIAVPASPTTFGLTGTCQITTADGTSTLALEVNGTVAIDTANPAFGDFRYDAKISGGTGRMAAARGKATIDGFAMFTSPGTGKATWVMIGLVADQ
jgi:hypothetical protein